MVYSISLMNAINVDGVNIGIRPPFNTFEKKISISFIILHSKQSCVPERDGVSDSVLRTFMNFLLVIHLEIDIYHLTNTSNFTL